MTDLQELVWTTLDGRKLRVGEMTRQHAWNAMRMLERNGYEGSFMHQAFKEKLGHISKQELFKFESLNNTYRRSHAQD